ncbi:hypothetical protein MA16_Dca010012 [Dendrobium catenatum]|uniref:B3 domain-containing protein n=1 Tax=Dendrobium catenatum TaxID=906689 RepID=A0A2I0VJ03_9ASPA|nr:hypothetical protein MA16_Dca010012 [Dendrobium catenatum]
MDMYKKLYDGAISTLPGKEMWTVANDGEQIGSLEKTEALIITSSNKTSGISSFGKVSITIATANRKEMTGRNTYRRAKKVVSRGGSSRGSETPSTPIHPDSTCDQSQEENEFNGTQQSPRHSTCEQIQTPNYGILLIVGLTFLTVKTLDSTDVSEEHARIRIPELLANDMLRIYLPLKERAIVDSTEEDGPIGMLNDGLNVLVFVPGMRFELKLTSWDVCDIVTNIKGSDWPRCVEYLKLKAGEKVPNIFIYIDSMLQNEENPTFLLNVDTNDKRKDSVEDCEEGKFIPSKNPGPLDVVHIDNKENGDCPYIASSSTHFDSGSKTNEEGAFKDVSEEHGRISIPELLANDMLRIYLSLNERAIVDSTEKDGPIGMLNDGLNVLVFIPGMRLELKLTSWDVFDIVTNIKGSDWPRCVEYLKLKEGDKVAIWIFRSQENSDKKDMPCFIFHKL